MKRYRNQRDFGWMGQQLHQVTASTEPPPSLSELARQMGCTPETPGCHFPTLCASITAKRQAELKKGHQARMDSIRSEGHQAVLVFHQQGRYPGTRQVTKLLSSPQDIRDKEARETWRIMVAALGLTGGGSASQRGSKGVASAEEC